MSRIWWRVLFWVLALSVLGGLLMPFTERGSRFLLDATSRLLPLEIEYGGGILAGEFQLRRLAWRGDTMQLELLDADIELAPGCLWRSAVCFQQLRARALDIALLPDAGSEPDEPAPAETSLVLFPVPMEADGLQLGLLRVHWDGGEWRQDRLQGSVHIGGSTIHVDRAVVLGAHLQLEDTGPSAGAVVLPEIDLPLKLLVGDLLLEQVGWDIYGDTGQLTSVHLGGGSWRAENLQFTTLDVRSPGVGQWLAAGSIAFSGAWPLTLGVNGVVPELSGWPEALSRQLSVALGGDLTTLKVQANTSGTVKLSASGQLEVLAPDMPFSFDVDADWPGFLALAELTDVPQPLADIQLDAPMHLNASGTLKAQNIQLQAAGNGLGYRGLQLELAASHESGRIVIADMHLRDAPGANNLRGSGELALGEALAWSAVLESDGLDLPSIGTIASGHLAGRLQVDGRLDGEAWSVSLSAADLQGTVNGLPARLRGYAGIDSQLRLLPGELRANVNGANLLLEASGETASPANLELSVEELGRWLPESRGSLEVKALVPAGWEELTLTGSLRDIAWDGLAVGSGRIDGNYRSAGAGSFVFGIDLANISFAGMELSSLGLAAKGTRSAQVLSLRSRGDINGVLEVAGQSGSSGDWSGQLAVTTLQTEEGDWYLGEPVAISYLPEPARVRLAAHCWHYRQTSVCPGETLLGEEGRASVSVDGALEAMEVFLPAYLDLSGSLKGQFTASWAADTALVLDGDIQARNLLFTRDFGGGESGSVRWERIDGTVKNGGQGLALALGMYSEDNRVVFLQLQLPANRDQALSGTLDIAGLQLGTFAPFAPALALLQGELRGNLLLRGTLDRPLAEGDLRLSGGNFALLGNPTELQQLNLDVVALGDHATVNGQGLLGGGPLTVSGDIMTDPKMRLELAIAGDRHELLLPPYTQMQVSEKLDLVVTGGLLDVAGDVVVHEGTLEQQELPEGSVTLSDDVVEVDYSGNITEERSAFDVSMNIALQIQDKFRVTSDMVDATVGGDLQVRQEPRKPLQVFGNLNVIGGEVRAYQQRLRIQRGTISFAGTPDNPEVNVRAQREIASENVTVGLQLRGTLDQLQLDLYSDPVMSQGETMSYLVRGRGLDTGASADGMAMALSLGTGLVNQSALVTELNRIPGISNLAFGAEGSTEADTAATVGGYIGERLYLSYGMGIYEPINVLIARLYLQTRLWLEVVSRLENSVDLYYSFDVN